MRTMAFAGRNAKEISRDPLTVGFGLGFPIILLVMLSLIGNNIPSGVPGDVPAEMAAEIAENTQVTLFQIQNLAPGIVVFGLSFIALFSGLLIAKDRTSSFMLRLFTSPMTSTNFIASYILPLIPLALVQMLITMAAALFLGLEFTANMLMVIVFNIPTALVFIAIGLLCGSLLNDKQVGGICGALLTNLSAWLSGTWFDVELVGGAFSAIANALPFIHAVKLGRLVLAGNYAECVPDLLWVCAYAVVLMAAAIALFRKKMNSDAA